MKPQHVVAGVRGDRREHAPGREREPAEHETHAGGPDAERQHPRAGDVRHSQADITKAVTMLGFAPTHRIGEGLQQAMAWYVRNLAQTS